MTQHSICTLILCGILVGLFAIHEKSQQAHIDFLQAQLSQRNLIVEQVMPDVKPMKARVK